MRGKLVARQSVQAAKSTKVSKDTAREVSAKNKSAIARRIKSK